MPGPKIDTGIEGEAGAGGVAVTWIAVGGAAACNVAVVVACRVAVCWGVAVDRTGWVAAMTAVGVGGGEKESHAASSTAATSRGRNLPKLPCLCENMERVRRGTESVW